MTWHPTTYRSPETGKPVRVKFRNGQISRDALPAAKWNWSDRKYDFDIVEWEEVE